MSITSKTIASLSKMLQKGEVSSTEATTAYLNRIAELDPSLNSYITVCGESALEDAARADKRLASGSGLTPLTGVPISVKDIFCTKGLKTTCASKMLAGFIPPYDSTVIKKLKSAGAVILGKTNMDEFAMGSSTENSAFGPTLNPWAKDRVPGGSSGGSAASVSADLCAASIGTDTGGSIRQPASCCGVVGLKPTYGRVSRYGMIAFASSLDQAGPLTKDVTDAAIMLGIMAGKDSHDATSIDSPVPDYADGLNGDVKGLRIGIPKEYFIDGMDSETEAIVRKAINVLEGSGAIIVDITLPHTEYAVSVYYIVATAEASSNLARYDGVKYGMRVDNGNGLIDMYKATRDAGFGAEVKRRIMLGTYALSSGYYDAYYKKAADVRALITRDFTEAFKECDVIATPTAPAPAFKIGERTADPLTMYLSDIFTISCNLAGLPGLSMPCGLTEAGLPTGLQLIGKPLGEQSILNTAYAYEQAAGLIEKKPEL